MIQGNIGQARDTGSLNRILDQAHGCKNKGTEAVPLDLGAQGGRLPWRQQPPGNNAEGRQSQPG